MTDTKVLIGALNAVRNGEELVDWQAKYSNLLKRVSRAYMEINYLIDQAQLEIDYAERHMKTDGSLEFYCGIKNELSKAVNWLKKRVPELEEE